MDFWASIVTEADTIMATRLIVATLLGAFIGFEREYMGKAAGLRTYALVSLGACLFSLVSIFGVQNLPSPSNIDPEFFRHNYDSSRIASQIVVGIGFLGAGMIIFRGSRIEGLTTAAGLWVSAALGTAVGFGYYFVSVVAAISVLGVLLFMKRLESWNHPNSYERHKDSGEHGQ